MDNVRWLLLGGLLAIVAGVLLIPALSLLFVLILRIAPLALLVAAIVGGVYLLTRRDGDGADGGADDPDADDRRGARPISTGEGFVKVPDYPQELPWWDELDGGDR